MSAISRQAVVVIHGMGEQRPMETLRSFVDGVHARLIADDPNEATAIVRSKPDSIGDIYETVRLSMSKAKGGSRPRTDFYEFYWAHNMRGTQFKHMFIWLRKVVFRRVSQVPAHLKKLWYTIWGLMILSALTGYFIYPAVVHVKVNPVISAALAALFPLALPMLISTVRVNFLNYLGDVARYFTPFPDNISERSNIRRQGIQFLKKLHDIQTQEKVDRIIVVAHSLGAVVAYDLLRLLWTEHNTVYDHTINKDQPAMKVMDDYANGKPGLTNTNLQVFQDAQFELWKEQQSIGNKWLISDFITLGAAVNSVDYFMVTNQKIDKMIVERELPVCPPALDSLDQRICYKSYPPYGYNGSYVQVDLLNHGALFAVVRWTNIFYSSDFVGGPMQRVFGKGIKDVKVPRNSLWCYPGGHNAYWDKADKNNALTQIVEAMKLSQ
ncbi:hypothetical protein ACSBL2_14375 [Pedobacter sp. AW31-3R]|uniref:hypothetical protein n=1 Tax=Pedobacter sp. AW31-3R TaxID=3445781 RepID=UPI003F9FDAA5